MKILNNIVNSLSGMELENTALYKRFLEERDHILKNKWYMSEKEGKDVGFERALIDWVTHYRNKIFSSKK
jgi:hypothetical protein